VGSGVELSGLNFMTSEKCFRQVGEGYGGKDCKTRQPGGDTYERIRIVHCEKDAPGTQKREGDGGDF